MIKNKLNLKNLLNYSRSLLSEKTYKYIISECDVFMPISQYMVKYYESDFPDKNMFPLPIQAPVYFLKQKVTFDEYKNNNRLIYVGQISYLRRLDFLIRVLANVRKTIKDMELWMVGPPQQKGIIENLKKLARNHSVYENVRFFGDVPKEKVPILISKSNIGLSPIPPLKSYQISSPTKTIEYLAVGIPVVANKEILDQQEVIQVTGGGYCPKYNIEDFSEKILKLIRNKNESFSMGQKGKEWVLKNRSYKNKAKELEELYYSFI
jgi:glycosyltransferase involved in cell wall biosynthesis